MKGEFPLKLKNSGCMRLFCLHYSRGLSLVWSCNISLYSVSLGVGNGLQFSAYPHLCDITFSSNLNFLKVPLQLFPVFSASSYPLLRYVSSLSKWIALPSTSQKLPGRNSSPSTPVSYLPPHCPVTLDDLPLGLTWASAWSWPLLSNSSIHFPSLTYFSKIPFYKYMPISSLPFH